ncbi:hypothetical protein ACGFIW_06465 [Micromonospora sp. NPDC048935]|uniref:hypothetical protein n=1 Tax=Micromonospora sp. NPDC048935 TaxID=3364262 RepID=UPI003716BC34
MSGVVIVCTWVGAKVGKMKIVAACEKPSITWRWHRIYRLPTTHSIVSNTSG